MNYLCVDKSQPSTADPFSLIIFLFRKPGDWGWQYLNTIFTGKRGGPSFRYTIQFPKGLFIHSVKLVLGPEPPKPYSPQQGCFQTMLQSLCFGDCVLFNVCATKCPMLSLWECLANSKCLAFALSHIVVKCFKVTPLCKHS